MIEEQDYPFFPVEYCGLDRAARLLGNGCEVEDLFHWAEINAITIYVKFGLDDFSPELSDGFEIDHCDISEDVHQIPDFTSYNMVSRDVVNENPDLDVDGIGEIIHSEYSGEYDDVFNSFGGPSAEFNATVRIAPINSDEDHVVVFLDGLWRTFDDDIALYRRNKNANKNANKNDMLWSIYACASEYVEGEFGEVQPKIVIDGIKISDIAERFVVVRADLQKISKHISLGKVMEKHDLIQEPNYHDSQQGGLHPLAERCAVTRELVLTAAIYIRNRLPSQCITAKDWADTIKYHEKELFGDAGMPVSVQTMERTLGSAMNKGAPHRKK